MNEELKTRLAAVSKNNSLYLDVYGVTIDWSSKRDEILAISDDLISVVEIEKLEQAEADRIQAKEDQQIALDQRTVLIRDSLATINIDLDDLKEVLFGS